MKSGDATTVSGLTSHRGERDAHPSFLQRKVEFVVEEPPPAKKSIFFIAQAPGIFAESWEIRFDRAPPRHRAGRPRSKYFKKSEKKACQPSKTPVILTAKPNQTNRRN